MNCNESIERLLQKYCDEAQVREALHRKAYYWYKRSLTCFQLPIIIMSALSGSMQFLSKSYAQYESTIVTCTASVSITVSVVSAVMTYLKLGEQKTKNEGSQIAWQNFYNTVSHELNLARELRQDPEPFLEETKKNYDRLFEISPLCNRGFILDIRTRVLKKATPEQQKVVVLFQGHLYHKVRPEVSVPTEPDGAVSRKRNLEEIVDAARRVSRKGQAPDVGSTVTGLQEAGLVHVRPNRVRDCSQTV